MSCTTTAKRTKVENTLSKADRDALVCGGPVSFSPEPAQGVVGLCRKIARECARRVLADRGRAFDVDDLEGDALSAAVEAAHHFDPARGIKFSTFAGGYIENALKASTDERRLPVVKAEGGNERFAGVTDDRDDEDDDPETRYGEYGLADLDADQRAAFDLLSPVAKRVVELLITGHDRHAIGLQLDLPAKDVMLAFRQAIDVMRKVNLVPADVDPHPSERVRQAEKWEDTKARNHLAAEAKDAKAKAKAAKRERLVGQIRGLILNEPGIKNYQIADRLGQGEGFVGKLIREHNLRPAAEPEGRPGKRAAECEAKRAARTADRDAQAGLIRDALAAEPYLSNTALAGRLGCSHGYVARLIREHGLRPVSTERQPPRRGK